MKPVWGRFDSGIRYRGAFGTTVIVRGDFSGPLKNDVPDFVVLVGPNLVQALRAEIQGSRYDFALKGFPVVFFSFFPCTRIRFRRSPNFCRTSTTASTQRISAFLAAIVSGSCSRVGTLRLSNAWSRRSLMLVGHEQADRHILSPSRSFCVVMRGFMTGSEDAK